MVTIGYNPAGVQQWMQTYNGTGDEFDSGNALALDNLGNVYVTGGSDNPNNTDFYTIKYSSTIGIQPISTEIPQQFSLSQNYPNPFNPSTKIRFDIPAGENGPSKTAMLVVFDISGKKVVTLVNSVLSAGIYEIDFDAANLASGIYFYNLRVNNYSETKKMILSK